MKRKKILILIILGILLINNISLASAQEYKLGPGDELLVTVWGYNDLKTEVMVRPDGMISLPLVGEVKAEGVTVIQLTKELTNGFAYYIINPHVSIMVKEFKKKKVFVLGEVTKPGMYKIDDNGSLVEAISNAEGLTANAYWSKISIVRTTAEGQQVTYADLGKVLKKGDLSQNIQLQPGDVVFVPKNNHKLDINQIAQALSMVTSVKYLTDN